MSESPETATPRQALPEAGDTVSIIKLKPDGTEATRYPGTILDRPPGWLVAEARWERERLDLGYTVFETGDVFIEYFSLDQPFNLFALFSESGRLNAWYCNVTYPTGVSANTVTWHDLYVDVIVFPDGRTLVLDEDELEAAKIETNNPALYRLIIDARDVLLDMAKNKAYPFSERLLSMSGLSGSSND